MNVKYDEEDDGGLDEPTYVVCSPEIKKKLNVSSDVLRVHKNILRRGRCWRSGQKIKLLKGACAGCHSNNVYATLEYIIFEGLRQDSCGEGRLICRPLGLLEDKGCKLYVDERDGTLDIRESKVFPIRVINSNMCVPVNNTEWDSKLKMHCQKLPSAIELLSDKDCQELEIDGGIPVDVLTAGDAPPVSIVAVIRPKAFKSDDSSKRLDQKFIVKDNNIDMTVEVNFRTDGNIAGNHIFSLVLNPTSHKGRHGLYCLPLRSKHPNLFERAGHYTFTFSLINFSDERVEKILKVQASADAGYWKVVSPENVPYTVRVGSFFEDLHMACCDKYGNKVKLTSVPKLTIQLNSRGSVLADVHSKKGILSADKSSMIIKGIVVVSSKLNDIRPSYEATLNISALDKAFSVALPCCVLPGTPRRITVHPPKLRNELVPGQMLEDLILEIFDEYDNHAKEGDPILLSVDGFSFEDRSGVLDGAICIRKVDCNGFVDICNILRVSKGFGKDVFLSVSNKDKVIFKKKFQTERRELRTVSKVFKNCEAGSHLENVVFEIVNSEGIVDESVDHNEKLGQSHTITITSNTLDIDDSVQYTFRHGRCTVRSIPLPHTEGVFSFSAAHSRHPELALDIEVHVENAQHENQRNMEHGNGVNPVFSPHDSYEDLPFLPQTSTSKASNLAHRIFSRQSPMGNALPASESPKAPKENVVPTCHSLKTPKKYTGPVNQSPNIPTSDNTGTQDRSLDILPSPLASCLVEGSLGPCEKDMGDYLVERALEMKHLRAELHELNKVLDRLRNASDLQDHNFCNGTSRYGKEAVLEKITRKSHSAAVICKMHEETTLELRLQDALGVVALLGNVDNIELSRMLALYLGDHLMCAVVCENYAAAKSHETNTTHHGKSMSGGCYTLCLEDIGSINCEPSSDPRELLALPLPTSSNGDTPPGFLGFAVNMINIESTLLEWKTTGGHGLRERLFYGLFGELQVYDKRLQMIRARSYIKGGAVSLDGGIIKPNGLLSFGQWEPDVIFPVLKNMDVTRYVKIAKTQLEIERVKRSCEAVESKFNEARGNYNSQRVWVLTIVIHGNVYFCFLVMYIFAYGLLF